MTIEWCYRDRNEILEYETMTTVLLLVFAIGFGGILNIGLAQVIDDVDQESLDKLKNVSETIKNLTKNYDIRLRPKFGGKPLEIDMDIVIASFDGISEVNMDYTITLYLNQHWRDERLAYSRNSTEQMTLTGDFADKIWVPDTFFANDKHSFLHDVTERNKMIRLRGNGYLAYGMRFTTTLACMMDLHNYPMDEQTCTVEIESYGYTMNDVIMRWKRGKNSIRNAENIELPQFDLMSFDTKSTEERLATGVYQRLSLEFRLKRNIGYFIFQTYLPSILIVALSWVSFWINHEATSARVALGITTVLTMTTISTGVRSSLPRISYVKAIDIYLVMCFVFVFAALLEYAAVNFTYWGQRAKRKKKKIEAQKQRQGDDVEMTEIGRMSPIPSLRNRQHQQQQQTNYAVSENESQTSCITPSFRIQTTVPRASYPVRTIGQRSYLVRPRGSGFSPGGFPHRREARSTKLLGSIRHRVRQVKGKIPAVKDVNKIDKLSRLVFPSLFILFNVVYWSFYMSQTTYENTMGQH